MSRNTNKMYSILDYLSNTKSHPTAQVVYDDMLKIYPNISLGTVYRNLQKLSNEGKITKLISLNGEQHFDYDTSAHAHLFCNVCGSIKDIDMPEIDINNSNGFEIKKIELQIHGICNKCKKMEELQ